MAIVSSFELLVKRIGPPGGIPPIAPGINAPLRRLLQGYYLTISNPNERLVNLRLQAVFPSLDSGSPFGISDRELVGGGARNHLYAYDRTGRNTTSAGPRELLGSLSAWRVKTASKVFQSATFQVDCHQTGLVNMVPNPASSVSSNPQIEIRGYIKLVQAQELRIVRDRLGWRIVFVNPSPIDLLVTPEIRGTFLDDEYSSSSPNLDFDQSNYALPTATGSAIINVSETVNPFFISLPGRPFEPIPISPGTPRYINPGALIESGELSGKINVAGQFSLNDKSIRYVSKLLKKQRDIKYSLKDTIRSIEDVIDVYGVYDKDDENEEK